jgi:AmmeMemoRadiSam system protein B
MASSGNIRQPAVAGRFYPADPIRLQREVGDLLRPGSSAQIAARPAVAVMAPHAGYVYSGGIAGAVFAAVVVPPRVILLCPNHTGMGPRISVVPDGAFRIPGADIPVDAPLAAAILREVPGAAADRDAHAHEHAIEVELPFLLARQPALTIVPIVLAGLSAREAIALGEALARAVAATAAPGEVLLVASSDMSHYLPDAVARTVDHQALEPLLAYDAPALYRTVVDNDISMCGFIPATAMLAYAHATGAPAPELVGYATSGDAFGDRSRVVGYAGVLIPR